MSGSVHPRLHLHIGIAASLSYNTFPELLTRMPSQNTTTPNIDFFLDSAYMTINASPDIDKSLLAIGIGLFPYKYNPEVRNLGEYMFRTGCYPAYINTNGFDQANAQLAGLQLSNRLADIWHNDLLLTSELYLKPFNDFSLTYITDLQIAGKALDIGAGIQLFRVFSANDELTSPRIYPNSSNPSPSYYFSKDDELKTDTLWYTYAGTKIMGRICFDPKPLLGWDILGKEDFKLYAEAIILGIKSYPADSTPNLNSQNNSHINDYGYEKVIEKLPLLLGFNVPTFKLLDVLSFEVEYFGKKYVNAVPIPTTSTFQPYFPIPNQPYTDGSTDTASYTNEKYEKNYKWKWSCYVKRTLLNKFTITAQAARDHIRTTSTLSPNIDREEALVKNNHWYWMLKLGCHF
ncbi:MAG: hypothetical protein JXA18_06390 [Chitinispirillaceae bacterium]|nr:hypothetical protein [Chitinispirillaceae bacterium]